MIGAPETNFSGEPLVNVSGSFAFGAVGPESRASGQ